MLKIKIAYTDILCKVNFLNKNGLEAARNEKPFALLSLLFALLSAGAAVYVRLKRKTQMEGKGQTEEDEQQETAESRKRILVTVLTAATLWFALGSKLREYRNKIK